MVVIEAGSDMAVIQKSESGAKKEYNMMSSHYISNWLTILSLRESDTKSRHHVILLRGSVNESQYRQLRVYLKLQYSLLKFDS